MVLKPDGELAAVRRLPPPLPCHHPGLLSTAEHDGFCGKDVRMPHFQQGGSRQGLPPDPHARQGHRQDGHHHAVQPVRVLEDGVRAPQRRQHFPEDVGQVRKWPIIHFCVPGRHHCRQSGSGISPAAPAAPPAPVPVAPRLVINGEKCKFGDKELDFQGHRVSAEGVAPLKKDVDALLEHPQPQKVQDLQAFLGTVNFYRRFLPAAASLLQPLTNALCGEARAKDKVPWSTEMEAAFTSIKAALANAAALEHPTPRAEICLMVDASATHV
jgi:hypothetical protein